MSAITPDAVLRHLAPAIVERVAEHGFRVVRHRVLYSAPPQIERFHARNPNVIADPRLHDLVRQLFAIGPSLALGLEITGDLSLTGQPAIGEPEHADGYARLSWLKGLGDPAYTQPGSIRHDLGAINTILNLVHTAASADEATHDTEIFFGPSGWYTHAGSLTDALAHVQALVAREDRGFEEVLAAVCDRAPKWASVLAAAYAADAATGPPPREVQAALDGEIPMDGWERLVLSSSLYFRPMRRRAQPEPCP